VPEKLETRDLSEVSGIEELEALEVLVTHEVPERWAVPEHLEGSDLEEPLDTVRRMSVSCSRYSDEANDESLEVASPVDRQVHQDVQIGNVVDRAAVASLGVVKDSQRGQGWCYSAQMCGEHH
jgi:hypothetical protein